MSGNIPVKSRDGLHGAGPIFKRRREALGLSAETIVHDALIPMDTLRKIESNRRNVSRSRSEKICGVLKTTVDEVMNEVVGLHEFLPSSHGLRLVTYFLRKDGVESPLEVSPSISLPPPIEDFQLVLRCIGDLAPGETLDVRETSRSEKEQWIQLARKRTAEIASSDPCPEAYAEIQALPLYLDPRFTCGEEIAL